MNSFSKENIKLRLKQFVYYVILIPIVVISLSLINWQIAKFMIWLT